MFEICILQLAALTANKIIPSANWTASRCTLLPHTNEPLSVNSEKNHHIHCSHSILCAASHWNIYDRTRHVIYMRTGAVSPSRQFGSWITTLIACSKSILFKDHPFLPYTDAALSAYSPPVRQTSPRDGRVAVLCKPNLTSGPGCPRRHVYCTRVTDKHLRRCQVYCPCGAGNPAN